MRDRYLFPADRKASEYRGVLEITPARARLLTPSQSARNVRWIVSIALSLAYIAVGSWILVPLVMRASALPVVGWVVLIIGLVLWSLGFFAVFIWWDRRSIPILADGPIGGVDLVLLGARSFGTYQDVRVKTLQGEEFRLVVDTRASRFWEAVRLLEGPKTPMA